MQAVPDYRPLHRRALDQAGQVLAGIVPADLARSTPCAGWDLSTLLRHMIGQNHGFADAVEFGDASLEAFAHRGFPPGGLQDAWLASADRLRTAFASAPLDRLVKLAEIRPDEWFPVAIAVGFQLLDTVIHTWDVAGEQAHVHGKEVYLWFTHPSHQAKLSNARIERGGAVATTRDWKVASALGEMWGA